MIAKKHITGIVLAGGKSSRMGCDKGFLNFNNKPMVQYSIDALNPLVTKIIIVSNNTNYDTLGHKRITDSFTDAGPVAGIYSGLQASTTEYNLVLSCDIPLITTKVLQKLVNAHDGVSEVIQAVSHGKAMPLVALYKTTIKDTLHGLLLENEKRLHVAVASCRFKNVILNVTDENSTTNINTMVEFKTLTHAYNH